jgi:hypothetical protein
MRTKLRIISINCPHGVFMRTKLRMKKHKLSSWSVHEDKTEDKKA